MKTILIIVLALATLVVIAYLTGFLQVFSKRTKATTDCVSLPVSDALNEPTTWRRERTINNGKPAFDPQKGLLLENSGQIKDQEAGIISSQKLCGDFDITIDFAGFEVENTQGRGELEIVFDRDGQEWYRVSAGEASGQDYFYSGWVKDHQVVKEASKNISRKLAKGSLRLARNGRTIYALAEEKDGWNLIATFNQATTDPAWLIVRLHTYGRKTTAKAIVRKFTNSQPDQIYSATEFLSLPLVADFRGDSLPEQLRNRSFNGGLISPTPSGLSLVNSGNSTRENAEVTGQEAGVITAKKLEGDFEAIVEFTNFTASENQAQTEFQLVFDIDRADYVIVSRGHRLGQDYFGTHRTVNRAPLVGTSAYQPLSKKANKGMLRLERKKEHIKTFYRPSGDKDWIALETFPFASTEPGWIVVRVHNVKDQSAVSTVVTKLTLTKLD